MTNLISRIKILEKQTRAEDTDISHICLIVDEDENGRRYYEDKEGIRHEYIAETFEGKKPSILVILKDYQGGTACQT